MINRSMMSLEANPNPSLSNYLNPVILWLAYIISMFYKWVLEMEQPQFQLNI